MSEDLDAEEAETKIYAISSEGGNIIYHVSKQSKPFPRKSLDDSRTYALTTYSETGLATKQGPKAEDPDFDKVDPKDLKLRVNPFGLAGSLDKDSCENKATRAAIDIGQAKRLDRVTCQKEGISFDDVEDAEEAVDDAEILSDNSKAFATKIKTGKVEKTTEIKATTADKTVGLVNKALTNGLVEQVDSETAEIKESAGGDSHEQNGEVNEDVETIVRQLLDEIVAKVAAQVKYEPPIVLQGSLDYMDSMESINDSQKDRQISTSRETSPDDVFSTIVAGTKVQLDTDSEGEEEGDNEGEVPGVHPLHTHLLLYSQPYDAQRTLYALTCLKAIMSSTPRLMACAISTTGIITSHTSHMSQLLHLLARHRRAVFGKNFYSEVPPDAVSGYRSIKYVEVLISVCLYYIRSYYPNLMMSQLKDQELNGNKEVQILSCEILAMMLSELVNVARDSGKSFSSYISDLLSRCKVQKALMHCLLASVYNNRQKQSNTDSSNLTEAIISFNDDNMDANTNETFQIKLLRLILVLILLEDQVWRYKTDDITAAADEKPSRQSATPLLKYLQSQPIVHQKMLMSAVLTALRQQHLCHLHRHWITMVTSALPYMGRALGHIATAVVNQLCINIELLSYLYENEVPKSG